MKNAPGATIIGHERVAGDADPERVLDRAPRRFKPVPIEIWLLQIPADAQ